MTPPTPRTRQALLHVFVRGPDRALWHKRQLGSHRSRQVIWDDWQCLGGVLASAPAIPSSLNGVNMVETVVRASDRAFWHKQQARACPGKLGPCGRHQAATIDCPSVRRWVATQ